MRAIGLALSLVAFVAANESDTTKGNTVNNALARATAATNVHQKMKVGVSSGVQDDDKAELLPSTDEELRLTAAISEQSQKVNNESSQLTVLQAKINSTVEQQQYAAYRYEVATRVAQRVVAAYLEAERKANDSQLALRDARAAYLAITLNKTKTTAVRKGVEMQLDMVSGNADNETLTLEMANATAAKAKLAMDTAINESDQAVAVLANRSGDLQEAMDVLNALNDELTEAPEDKVDDLTEALHNQALVVANLTNMVNDAQDGVNETLQKRDKAAAEYLAASEALDNASANVQDHSDSIESLTEQKARTTSAERNASLQVTASQGNLSKAERVYNQSVEYAISLRRAVQNATDQELNATMYYAQMNVSLLAFQNTLDNQTNRLHEEMDKLNLLNDQLKKEQDRLERGGSPRRALPVGPMVLSVMSFASLIVMPVGQSLHA